MDGASGSEQPQPTTEADREHYDFVIIGTGLTETAVSSLLAQEQKYKILHIDTHGSYGSDFSTLQYRQLEKHFRASNPIPDDDPLVPLSREFNIDLTPKLLLRDSPLKDFLVSNEIHELVSFVSVRGSYLFSDRQHRVPATEAQSLKSSAVSFLQKPRVMRFFWNVRAVSKDPGASMRETVREEFAHYGLNRESIDFIGHAVALNLDDSYLDEHPREMYRRIVRYVCSIVAYDGSDSPYIYPQYGLSEICQAFARRSALFGTLFMLNAKIDCVHPQGRLDITDPNGGAHRISASRIIADPSYYPGSTVLKRIIRCIMILRTDTPESRNIIFLKRQLDRSHDIFCVVLGPDEMAAPAGYEVGILSTVMETEDPDAEIEPVLHNFNIVKKYTEVRSLLCNQDTEHEIFTRGVDESVLMDPIYDDIQAIMARLSNK